MKRQTLVLVLSLCAASTALATTYVRVEKDGTKTYSDRPIPGGQPVELQPAQTYSTPPPAVSSATGGTREQQLLDQATTFRYESCAITPENDSTIQNPQSVTISVSTSPSLRPQDVITLTVDGQSTGQNSQTFTMSPVYRGSHTVQARVTSSTGAVLCDASSVFHVFQPGLNSPARQAPPPRR